MKTLNQLKFGDTVYDLAAKYDAEDNNIKETYSTKDYVNQKISDLVNSAPETLDTLNELAAALNNDSNFAATITKQLGNKVDKVEGKQLSTNDYSNEEKKKVSYLMNNIKDSLSYGISFDSTVADPECTRVGNPLLHQSLPIQSLYKGCVVKDGVLQYYLDPNDWSKKASADGTTQEPSVLDGTDGEVCVETPEFFLKCTTVGTVTTVRESLYQLDDTYKRVPSMFVDAYRGTVNDSKLRSVVNTSAEFRGGNNNAEYDSDLESDPFKCLLGKPRTNISRADFRTYARNIGKELLSYDQYKAIFYWNYVIEYANFNSQADYNADLTPDGYHQGGLGAGVTSIDSNDGYEDWYFYNRTNPITPCGYGNDIGNFTGIKTIKCGYYSMTFQMPRWRGFDNPFGDINTILDGCVIDDSNIYIILNKENYTDTVDNIKYSRMYSTLPTKTGYIKSLQLGEYADIVPKTLGGSATTYMCDTYYLDIYNHRVHNVPAFVGGDTTSYTGGGLARFGHLPYVSNSDGARGVFVKD